MFVLYFGHYIDNISVITIFSAPQNAWLCSKIISDHFAAFSSPQEWNPKFKSKVVYILLLIILVLEMSFPFSNDNSYIEHLITLAH